MRNFGLIGRKLSHSYSKDYFDRKFRTENISDSTYSLFEIDKIDELPLLLRKFPDLAGFNVTFPFKQSVIPFLDNISDDAKEIGAVNTVLVEKSCGRRYLTGYNTDYIGFWKHLKINVLITQLYSEPVARVPLCVTLFGLKIATS